MLSTIFVITLAIMGTQLQPTPVYFQTLSSGYRPPIVQSYRPYWTASSYPGLTSQFLVARAPTPNVAYAVNLYNTKNTCLTNDVRSPCTVAEPARAKAEQTTAPTTASCPSPINTTTCVTTDPMQNLAPMLLELFNPSVWKLIERLSDQKKILTETTVTDKGVVDITDATTVVCNSVTETCDVPSETAIEEVVVTSGTTGPAQEAEVAEFSQNVADSFGGTQPTTGIPPETENDLKANFY